MQAFKRVRLRVIEKIKSKYAENQNAFRLFGGIKSNLCEILKKMIFFDF